MATYTKGGSTDEWIFPGSLNVTGTFTTAGPENWTIDATEEAIQVDAYTTPHTGANIIDIRTDVNSASVKVLNADINVTTALSTGEKVYGAYIDINGKADDHGDSEFAAFYATSANTTASTNNSGVELAGTFDTGIKLGSTFTADGILISGGSVDAIHVSGAASAVGLHLANTAVDGVLIDGACTDAIHVSGATTNGINLAGTSSAAGVLVAGVCVDGISITSANADGIHISGTNTASALHISGDQADAIIIDATSALATGMLLNVDADTTTGINMSVDTGKTLATGISMSGAGVITNAISIDYSESATETIAVTVATGKTVGTAMSLSGAGIYTTGITLDATGIMTDGIKISATTPVDGIEISSACSATGINLSGANLVGLGIGSSTTGIALTGTQTTGINVSGAVATGLNVQGSAMTTGLSVGLTGVTYTTGIALGVTGGTLTSGISVVGAMTTGINFTSAAAIGTLINATAACAHLATRGIFIGADSNTEGSGIALNGAAWETSQANALYSDDGGVAATGYTETFTVRHLTTATVASGDVSFVAIHPDMYLNADYTGTGGISAIWGNTTIATGKTINLNGSLGDVGGASFGIDIVGTLAANSHACGCSVGVGGSGTKTGILSGFRVRGATGTVDWDAFLSIEDGDGSWTSMTTAGSGKTPSLGTAGPTGSDSAPAYWMNVYIGETKYYFPVWASA